MPDPSVDPTPLSDIDDQTLLDAHLAGDRDAFAVLVRRHARLMTFIAVKIVRDETEAEDVVQSALLNVLRSAAKFDRRASVKTWIGRITRNAALDARRRRLARATTSLTGDEQDTAAPVDVAAVVHGRTVADELLQELPETTRRIVVMIDMLDLSFATVAEILDIPVGTVKSRRWRALRALAARLER